MRFGVGPPWPRAGADRREPANSCRLFALAAVLCLLLLGLAGCELLPVASEPASPTPEPEEGTGPAPTETPPPGVTSIIFWQPFALDRSQGLLLGEMIRDFEAENPDLEVTIAPKSGYASIHGSMLAALAGDEALPDLGVAFPSMIAEYAAYGALAPLDPYVYDLELGLSDEDLADIQPALLESGRLPAYGGQLMAFPFVQNAVGMWVNNRLLTRGGWDHPPATWQEFEQACFDILAATGVRCYPFVESVSTFNAWLYSRGGDQLDADGQSAVFNGPAGVESLALLRRLLDAGLAWRPEEPFGDYVAFANGEAAFTFSSTGNSSWYVDAYEGAIYRGNAPFRWYQTMIPQADPARPATVLYGSSFFIVGGDPEKELAAWRLIRWFTGPRQTGRWASELEAMPVRASALGVMTDTLETYPFYQAQVEKILPYGRPEPAVRGELEVREILHTAIISVTQGFSDPQTALDEAARDANAVLRRVP